MKNWASNVDFSSGGGGVVHLPTSAEEVVALVRQAAARRKTVRCVGTGHSFNRVADSDGCLMSLRGMNRVLGLDESKRTVKVEGGITYGVLAPWL